MASTTWIGQTATGPSTTNIGEAKYNIYYGDYYANQPSGYWSAGIPQSDTGLVTAIDALNGNNDTAGAGSYNLTLAIANAASFSQIQNFTLGTADAKSVAPSVELEVTATSNQDETGSVYRVLNATINNNAVFDINTPSSVDLGVSPVVNGILEIDNNNGTVIVDDDTINGSGGTVLLNNSTLGNANDPLAIASGETIDLENGSEIYLAADNLPGKIAVDSNTSNTVVFSGAGSTIATAITGVTQNTNFAFSDETPQSASYTKNDDGSYTLDIAFSNGQHTSLTNVQFAQGYAPATPVVSSGGQISATTTTGQTSYTPDAAVTYNKTPDLSAYTSGTYESINGKTRFAYTGQSTTNPYEWNDPANWSGNLSPTTDNTADVSINGSDTDPVTVVADQVTRNQISSLSVGANATLEITAQPEPDFGASVFATQGLQLVDPTATLIINTPGVVSLGGPNEVGGTLKIINSNQNVKLDGSRLNGSGQLILANSVLGTFEAPLRNNITNTTLTDNSTLISGFYASGQNVTFDDTTNTVFIQEGSKLVSTVFSNVGANTRFGIVNDDSTLQVLSASYSPTGITTSSSQGDTYSLTLTYKDVAQNNGDVQTIVIPNITTSNNNGSVYHPPANPTIEQLPNGDWVVANTAPTSNGATQSNDNPYGSQFHVVAPQPHNNGAGSVQHADTSVTSSTAQPAKALPTDNWTGTASSDPSTQTIGGHTYTVRTGDYYDGNDQNSPNWSAGVPQSRTGQSVTIDTLHGNNDGGLSATNNLTVAVANAASYAQIQQLTLGTIDANSVAPSVELEVTAVSNQDENGSVYRVLNATINNTAVLDVNTKDSVDLGISPVVNGVLEIDNNNGAVIIDDNHIDGSGGTVLLNNSTLGSNTDQLTIGSGETVDLNGTSTIYVAGGSAPGTINVDPNEKNTVVFGGTGDTIATAITGVSQNTNFAFSDGTVTSATFTANPNNGLPANSYTLDVTFSNGQTTSLNNIQVAAGYSPKTPVISTGPQGDSQVSTPALQPLVYGYTAPATYDLAVPNGTTDGNYQNTTGKDRFNWTGNSQTNGYEWDDGSNWGPGFSPTTDNSADTSINGSDTNPVLVIADKLTRNQISSLSIGQDATLEITAQPTPNSNAQVFGTQGLYMQDGSSTLIINTPGAVTLGGEAEIGGTLKIINNNQNVKFDNGRIQGDGELILANSTVGTFANPLRNNITNTNLTDNSTLITGFYASGQNITFDDTTNTVFIQEGSKVASSIFANVGANTQIGIVNATETLKPVSAVYLPQFGSVASNTSSSVPSQDDTYSLTMTYVDPNQNNGQTQTIVIPNITVSSDFDINTVGVEQLSDGRWVVYDHACFLSGTTIETVDGPRNVEDIRIGDTLVLHGDTDSSAPVIWTGYADVKAQTWRSEDEAGYPVRITAHALADNVPSRDLLVTAEHCFLLGGAFVPARMLVNGGSIRYDRTITSYRYHHIETERHSVIIAENTPTESFLDTGTRRNFVSGQQIGRAMNWETDAAAPLNTSLAHVQPIYDAIVARAIAFGLDVDTPETTTDADLKITDANGRELSIRRQVGNKVMIALPEETDTIILHSRSCTPARAIGPFYDDRRTLGVLVGSVTLWEAGETSMVSGHLTDETLPGWHAPEQAAMRWTTGNGAMIRLDRKNPEAPAMLALEIVTAGPYLAANVA